MTLGLAAFDILQTMIESDVMLSVGKIANKSGYSRWEAIGSLEWLRAQGFVRHYKPKFLVTDRGRLAWALEAARRNRSAAKRRGKM